MRTIANVDEFAALGREGLDIVLDPTVLLVAEKFCSGASGVDDATQAWAAIDSNLGCLAEFIDALVLSEHVPVFDFWMTRQAKSTAEDEAQALGSLAVCNALRPGTLEPIGVEVKAWSQIATEVVVEQLGKLPALSSDVVTLMSDKLAKVGWRYEQRRMGSDDMTGTLWGVFIRSGMVLRRRCTRG